MEAKAYWQVEMDNGNVRFTYYEYEAALRLLYEIKDKNLAAKLYYCKPGQKAIKGRVYKKVKGTGIYLWQKEKEIEKEMI